MKKAALFTASLIAALTLLGCDDKDNQVTQVPTVVMKHVNGETEIPAHPKNIIVFDTALLDTINVIGGDVQGVPQPNIPFPTVIAKYQDSKYLNVGTLQEPNFEAISAANPDLIITSGRAVRANNELAKITHTILLSLDWSDIQQSMHDTTLKVASLFGPDQEAKAKAELAKFDASIAETKAKASQAGTAMFVMINGGRVASYGPGTRFGFIFDVLGMKPALDLQTNSLGTHGNVISMELLLQTNPDWIFVLDRETAIGESSSNAAAKQVLNNELVQQTNAYKNDRIIYIDSAALYLAGGLGTYQDFVESINHLMSR